MMEDNNTFLILRKWGKLKAYGEKIQPLTFLGINV